MKRDAFEQLLSEWLDARERGDLADSIERVVSRNAALGATRDAWLRVDEMLRVAAAAPASRVRWSALKARILARVDAAVNAEVGAGDALEAALAGATSLPQGVAWQAARARIAAVVATLRSPSSPRVRSLRLRARTVATLTIGLAAAALCVLALRPGVSIPTGLHGGVAVAHIESARSTAPDERSISLATVQAQTEDEQESTPPCVPQILLIIDAPREQPEETLIISRSAETPGDGWGLG